MPTHDSRLALARRPPVAIAPGSVAYAAIIRRMGERDEGALERAEGFFKKVLGRIGSSVDERLSAGGPKFAAHEIGALAAAVERALEEKVRADARGVRRIAPDRFAV